MTTGTVQFVLQNGGKEESRVHVMVAQAIQSQTSLFVGRFLTDLLLPDEIRCAWAQSGVVLRQYGYSCRVNAPPPLADAARVEIGLEEAEAALRSGAYDQVLLSRILTAVEEDLLTASDLLALIGQRPDHVTLILTGLGAPVEIVGRQDHSTERS